LPAKKLWDSVQSRSPKTTGRWNQGSKIGKGATPQNKIKDGGGRNNGQGNSAVKWSSGHRDESITAHGATGQTYEKTRKNRVLLVQKRSTSKKGGGGDTHGGGENKTRDVQNKRKTALAVKQGKGAQRKREKNPGGIRHTRVASKWRQRAEFNKGGHEGKGKVSRGGSDRIKKYGVKAKGIIRSKNVGGVTERDASSETRRISGTKPLIRKRIRGREGGLHPQLEKPKVFSGKGKRRYP